MRGDSKQLHTISKEQSSHAVELGDNKSYVLGPYNTSNYPITIVVIPLIILLYPCNAHIVTITPHRSPLFLLGIGSIVGQ